MDTRTGQLYPDLLAAPAETPRSVGDYMEAAYALEQELLGHRPGIKWDATTRAVIYRHLEKFHAPAVAPTYQSAEKLCRALRAKGWTTQDCETVEVLAREVWAVAPAPSGWQPIETAPKRLGQTVLLYWTTRGVSSGYWQADADGIGWRGDMDLCVPRDQEKCTHWMPLPARPAEGERPTDDDVDAAIDELVEKAMRSGPRGSSGHAWGAESRVRALSERLKRALRSPICAKCGQPQDCHCDLDEPGVDHDTSCEQMHHEFTAAVDGARRKS